VWILRRPGSCSYFCTPLPIPSSFHLVGPMKGPGSSSRTDMLVRSYHSVDLMPSPDSCVILADIGAADNPRTPANTDYVTSRKAEPERWTLVSAWRGDRSKSALRRTGRRHGAGAVQGPQGSRYLGSWPPRPKSYAATARCRFRGLSASPSWAAPERTRSARGHVERHQHPIVGRRAVFVDAKRERARINFLRVGLIRSSGWLRLLRFVFSTSLRLP